MKFISLGLFFYRALHLLGLLLCAARNSVLVSSTVWLVRLSSIVAKQIVRRVKSVTRQVCLSRSLLSYVSFVSGRWFYSFCPGSFAFNFLFLFLFLFPFIFPPFFPQSSTHCHGAEMVRQPAMCPRANCFRFVFFGVSILKFLNCPSDCRGAGTVNSPADCPRVV